ncbi:MAG: BamA/TamA family outer membrane protein [Planctomycetes bacterium]|nr:BamA/TamA family outer membrane protein [Planctomycetota bacterium]
MKLRAARRSQWLRADSPGVRAGSLVARGVAVRMRAETCVAWLAGVLLVWLSACTAPRSELGAPVQVAKRGGVRLEFDGALAHSAERLATVITDDLERLESAPNRRAVLDDAAFALQRFYRRAGFADAEVEFEELDRENARFVVREGPRVLVDAFEFPGASEFAAAELAELYEGPEVGDRRALVSGAVSDLARGIELRYVARGFARVEVGEPRIERELGAALARVVIDVREGRVFRFGAVAWTGELSDFAAELDGLRSLAERRRGAIFTQPTLGALCTDAAELFTERGHPEARVRPERETFGDDGEVALELAVEPGPHVVIAAIDVRGLERVERSLVLSRVRFREGREWRASDQRDSLRDLYRTGLFAAVELDLEGTGGARTLVVRVRETQSREFYVEPGYGSYERLRLGLGWRDRNWFGTGRALKLEGSLAELAQRASASLVDQHLFESDVEGALTLFGGQRIEPSFTSADYGGSLTFTRQFGRHWRGIVVYQFRRSGVSDVDADVTTSDLVQDVDIGSVTVTPSFDDRDQYFVPTRGRFAQVSVEYASGATGSQLDFVRTRWNASQFFALGEKSVLGASWRGGVIAPLPGTDTIPLQERFFNGGENTVRAFRENELGPTDADGEPLGGEGFNVFSFELRRELLGNLDGALFWDVGDVVSRADEFLALDDLRHGPGVGLRYRLPVGPVRLDLGHNLDPRDGESRWVLHLSVGMSF